MGREDTPVRIRPPEALEEGDHLQRGAEKRYAQLCRDRLLEGSKKPATGCDETHAPALQRPGDRDDLVHIARIEGDEAPNRDIFDHGVTHGKVESLSVYGIAGKARSG